MYSFSFLLNAAEIVETMKWIITQKYYNELVYWMCGNTTVYINTWVLRVHTQEEIFHELVDNQLSHVDVHMGVLPQMSEVLYYLQNLIQMYTALAFFCQD